MSSREEQRQKIKDKYKQLNADDLIYIPARKPLEVTEDSPKKRVCAYCRVSTDDPAQTTSYELQKEHYEEEINKNPDWEFAGIYADEGISATSMKHRDNFNRMIAAAEAGKIDIIVTKAVSRFARNVVDCLSMVRHLSNLKPPVAVKFETEGINTLDSTSEMILAVMAAAAQEESKTKSNAMNWSLENRFKKGKFLTPVLLGYDHDEDGNLIINEEEAQTVKLIYYMYLSGFPTGEIAEILSQLKRPTKLGNTRWCSGTVRSIMQNERNCGNVLSWKTFTYDFWEHKKRKNNHDKPQVLKVDHHEGIVSHEIFDAAQHKLASEKYLRKGIPLPALEVIEHGALRGYVSVNRLWSGFSESDYCEACESVYEEQESLDAVKSKDEFSLDGYQVVSNQLFYDSGRPYMSIARGQIRFNTVCLKKFEDVEYVELLLNSVEKCIAVRPCDKDNPNAIKWGSLQNSKWIVRPKSCSGFASSLYNIMDWSADCGYKVKGAFVSEGDEKVLFFSLIDPEITQYKKIPVETDEESENQEDSAYKIEKHVIEPESWNSGSDFNYIVFKEKHFSGNWQIMQPTAIFKVSGNMTSETLNKVHEETRELLDSLCPGIAG
ncbi:recombinase family protein [Lactonifactor longoviformis]|uniref:recombinase family protein n=1 Tax=Lactonifactor longoviformis TaxID=341220 RepID=UPI001D015C23|nr:recombinase family protein [Lactonifactor longoviformis]MCB5714533.1 recombinase family protein [Lactonifactor longoviformis]MCB5718487.1 recombinase family protein [Lactonifactor longoviformis]